MRRSPRPLVKVVPVPRDATGELILLLVLTALAAAAVCGLVVLIRPVLGLVLA